MKTVYRCGICDMNFDDKKSYHNHFKSRKHNEKLKDPLLMEKKIKQSQAEIALRILGTEEKK